MRPRNHARVALYSHDSTGLGHVRVPPLLSVADDRLELGPLEGHEPLAHVARTATAWERAWEAVGACLERLATGPMDLDLPVHDATAEREVTLAWVERAVAGVGLPPRDPGPSLLPLHARAEPPSGLAHRDLHAGQLLFGSGRPGILDADTLAYAEPALDLANLLVHLDLRVDQHLLSCADRRRAADALLAGAAPDAAMRRRLPYHQLACRSRLAGVCAFRPRWHALACRWYEAALADGSDAGVEPQVVRGPGWGAGKPQPRSRRPPSTATRGANRPGDVRANGGPATVTTVQMDGGARVTG